MRDLIKIGNECIEDLKAIGYEFPKPIKFVQSNRMKRTWGLCSTCKNWSYTQVKIATFLLQDDVPEKQLRQTVYHELAHAIDNNENGHVGRWKRIADMISDCYNMDIQQYCTNEEVKVLKSTEMYSSMRNKYTVKCCKCGVKCERMGYRAPKWYSQVERYKCKCGGELKRV